MCLRSDLKKKTERGKNELLLLLVLECLTTETLVHVSLRLWLQWDAWPAGLVVLGGFPALARGPQTRWAPPGLPVRTAALQGKSPEWL